MMEFLDCGIRTIASAGNTVFTERTDRFVCMGNPVVFDLVAVFELNENDQITAWREYFDSASVARSMGIDQDQMTSQ
jgi:limonene-1,2-epoxide hydrolase